MCRRISDFHKTITLFLLILSAAFFAGCVEMLDKMPHKKWGFIDKTGHMVIEPQFDDVTRDQYGGCVLKSRKPFKNFSEGLCAVRLGKSWGYIDKTGKFVVPAKYDNAGNFSNGLAAVCLGTKYGYIDKSGKEVIPLQFEYSRHAHSNRNNNPDWDFSQGLIEKYEFSEGLGIGTKGGREGYIDKTGAFVIQPNYVDASPFCDGLASVQKAGDTNPYPGLIFIDKTGKEHNTVEQHCLAFSENTFLATNAKYDQSRRLFYLDANGKRLSSAEYEDARLFCEGLAAVVQHFDEETHASYGYIDHTGKLVIPPKFDISGNNIAGNFRNGRAIVSKLETDALGNNHNLHGIINKDGNWITRPKYDHISAYCDGLARTFSNNETIYLDMNGNEAVKSGVVWGNSFSEGLAAVMAK